MAKKQKGEVVEAEVMGPSAAVLEKALAVAAAVAGRSDPEIVFAHLVYMGFRSLEAGRLDDFHFMEFVRRGYCDGNMRSAAKQLPHFVDAETERMRLALAEKH